ncbi:two component regulator [Nitzschia inconspicua]|uniref:Two component regulator n=1 Tax=Nitzschia inconspicua TaxID=303405 RepID=A0A9K3LS81_9STRA|nr:two component regulator [Nitzschia inconspicua]
MTDTNDDYKDTVTDDGLNSLAWTESPEEDYLKQVVKEENKRQQQEISPKLAGSPLAGPNHHGTSAGHVNNDDDDLPNAIKLMDVISVEAKPKRPPPPPPAKPVQNSTLDKIFGTTSSASKPQSQTLKVTKDDTVDLALDDSSLPEDRTINQMIHEMEQEEENRMFGESNSVKEDGRTSMSTSFIRRSLLAAMNAGRDDKSTNESLAGQNTVNDIIMKMEQGDNESIMMMNNNHVDDGTIRTWTNFHPIARSVYSQDIQMEDVEDDQTTPSALLQEAMASMIAAKGTGTAVESDTLEQSTPTRKNFFVTDDTSVGSFTDEVEIAFQQKRNRNYDQENDAATMMSYGNQNTMVSSLSYDGTYYRLAQQRAAALPTTKEETPWWSVDTEHGTPAGNLVPEQNQNDNNNMKTSSPVNSIQMKQPMTPSTYNSDAHLEIPHPLSAPTLISYKKGTKEAGACNFFCRALRDNKIIRLLILISALCFAAFAGLGIVILLQEQGNETTSVDYSPLVQETPPPFQIEYNGSNITFDPYGLNVTVMPSSQSATTEQPPSTDQPTPLAFPPGDLTDSILETLREKMPQSLEVLEDPSSPQFRALQWLVSSPPTGEVLFQPARIIQRWVLAVLFYGTHGDEWLNSSGWLTDANECSWFTTAPPDICDSSNLMTDIDLQGNGLRGVLPEELILLAENLVSINLNGNSIVGTIPNFISELTNLGSLHLNGNLHTGTIPSTLGRLSSTLWSLRLGQMNLTGSLPTQLGELTLLEYLSFASNDLTGTIPTQLGELSNLVQAELYDNQLTGTIPTELSTMTSMASLELQQNLLQGTVESEICLGLGAPDDATIRVDCSDVSCGCCEGC